MFQFQPFTQAEIDADPRIAALLADKRRLLSEMQRLLGCGGDELFTARDWVQDVLDEQQRIERQREAAHYAAVQAENVRRGWKPATWREILGEPRYVPHEPGSELLEDDQERG